MSATGFCQTSILSSQGEDQGHGFNSAEQTLPLLIYGTAWKTENTTTLVTEALAAGFRAFDTAAQPKHYREDLLGIAVQAAITEGRILRNEIYIQTKFTTVAGHDLENMPYDPKASLRDQVTDSITSSLRNLGQTDTWGVPACDVYIDCLILHACLPTVAQTLEVWETMATFVPHSVRCLGISNLNFRMLRALWPGMRLKPQVLQNAFTEARGHDQELRTFCKRENILYQGFAILKKNSELLNSSVVQECARTVGTSSEVALYGLLQEFGIAILNGSTNAERMRADVKDLKKLRQFLWNNSQDRQVGYWVAQLSAMIENKDRE